VLLLTLFSSVNMLQPKVPWTLRINVRTANEKPEDRPSVIQIDTSKNH